MNLRDIVFENLDSARENGAFETGGSLVGATPAEIADDMIALAEDCIGYSAAQLLPYVQEWCGDGL